VSQRRSSKGLRLPALLAGVVLLAACATPQIEAQWRDPQFGAGSMQGRAVLVVCHGLDLTLERICEDRLAADLQSVGIRVVRADPPREPGAAPPGGEALLATAKVARAQAVLAMRLDRAYDGVPPGGAVGVGVGGGSVGRGSGVGGTIGITLPLGGLGPALVSGATLTDVASGRLAWSGRARGAGGAGEAAQVGELTRVTAEALKGAGLF
jgi:hypothetical protein